LCWAGGDAMTEAEWLACDDPNVMLAWLGDAAETIRTRWHGPVEVRRWRVSERKLWLFLVAAHCLDAQAMLSDAGWSILEALGDWAEGKLPLAGLTQAVRELRRRESNAAEDYLLSVGETRQADDSWDAAERLVALCRRAGGPFEPTFPTSRRTGQTAGLLREIVGNPFRPVAVDPLWLAANDGAVLHLANEMASSRDYSSMPVLADALEDAGCDEAAILAHLRSPGPHVRGCWPLDLVLGKL
jgi:hypothetical protein